MTAKRWLYCFVGALAIAILFLAMPRGGVPGAEISYSGEHRPQIEHLIDELERHETLDRFQIDACLGAPHIESSPVKTPAAAA